jgi:hypothetical protein
MADKKNKMYSNDPQAVIPQRKKNYEKARLKADKLISEVSRAGGYAITALGALGLGLAYKATKDDKKPYSDRKRYQQPRKVDIDKVRKPNLFD